MKKLLLIQTELKAPKNQRNNFGNYNYRSAEDILEALKPLLLKYKASLTITDDLVVLGEHSPYVYPQDVYDKNSKSMITVHNTTADQRFYVKSTVTLTDIENNESVQTSAFAREEEVVKGMSSSQITGSASSYARKYALNGMFAIDDTKDADNWNKHGKEAKEEPKEITPATMEELSKLQSLLSDEDKKLALKHYKVKSLNEIDQSDIRKMIARKEQDAAV